MLLKSAGVNFQVQPAELDEERLTAELGAQNVAPAGVALALAEQKALSVSHANPGALVLGGDSVLVFGSELIGKCRDRDSLRQLLQRLAGHSHELISAAALAS